MVSVVPLRSDKQLQHRIFLAGQMHAGAVDFDRLGVEVHGQLAGADDRLRMALGAADDRMDARDQLVAVEWLGDIIVGAEAQGPDLRIHLADARQDQHRGRNLGGAKLLEHVIAVHVGQIEVEQDDVVIIELAEIEAFLAKIGGVDVEAFRAEHQLDALGDGRLVFDQQNPHAIYPLVRPPVESHKGCALLTTSKRPLTIRFLTKRLIVRKAW